METFLPDNVRYFFGFIIYKTSIFQNTSPFKYWKHLYYTKKFGEDNPKYWSEYGNLVLKSMENAGYSEKVDYSYIETIIELSSKSERKTDYILELGGGYFRNILILSEKIPEETFFNIDFSQGIEEKLAEINNQKINLIRSSVTQTENYKHILQRSKIIFTYGLFMYLNESQTIQVFADIKKLCKSGTQIVIVEPGKTISENNEFMNCELLQSSFRRETGTYIHNYPKLFENAGFLIEKKTYNTKNINIFIVGKTSYNIQ